MERRSSAERAPTRDAGGAPDRASPRPVALPIRGRPVDCAYFHERRHGSYRDMVDQSCNTVTKVMHVYILGARLPTASPHMRCPPTRDAPAGPRVPRGRELRGESVERASASSKKLEPRETWDL